MDTLPIDIIKLLLNYDNTINLLFTNKYYNLLDQDDYFWKQMYVSHFNDNEILSNVNYEKYKQYFELCYHLTILNENASEKRNSLLFIYDSIGYILLQKDLKYAKSLLYLHHLNFIEIKVGEFIIIPEIFNKHPTLKEIKIKKVQM